MVEMRWSFARTPRCLALAMCVVIGACSGGGSTPPPGSTASAPPAAGTPQGAGGDEPLPDVPSPYDALPPKARVLLDQPFTGDFDAMVERRLIRAGVVFNRTHYFIDRGVQRGISYESIKLFEEELNRRLKTGLLHVHVALVPMSRDQLFPALQAGKVDFVAASLTITPARRKLAAFSQPLRSGVSEVPVTPAGAAPIRTIDDLSGREVFIRRSSSYFESVDALNASLASRGRAPVVVREAPEALEDDDILEMVNAGLVDATIVDDYLVEFWQKIFPNVRAHAGAAVRTGGELGVGVRQNNPKLLRAVNIWVKEYGPKTAFGNIVEKRYLQDAKYVRGATSEAERKKFQTLVKLFETYGQKYDVDSLLMTAQGYQESRLDQSVRSRVGAVGVMQVMPATGKELDVGDITKVEPNVHAGVKYFRFMRDQYYKDEPMTELDKSLMTFASYNAGPGRLRQLRAETARRGLDPNVWFGNVERIASERIGRETVQYVSNIFKYYVAYRLVQERERAKAAAKDAR